MIVSLLDAPRYIGRDSLLDVELDNGEVIQRDTGPRIHAARRTHAARGGATARAVADAAVPSACARLRDGVSAVERASCADSPSGGRVESSRRHLRRQAGTHRHHIDFDRRNNRPIEHRAHAGVRTHPVAQRPTAMARGSIGRRTAPRSAMPYAVLAADPEWSERYAAIQAQRARSFWTDPRYADIRTAVCEARRNPSETTRERHRQAMLQRYRDPDERIRQARLSAAAWARDAGMRRQHVRRNLRARSGFARRSTPKRVRAALDQTGSIRGAARRARCDRSVFRRFPKPIAQFRGRGTVRESQGRRRARERPGDHDVYCLTVPEAGNFALEAGVFVRNCGIIVNVTPLRARVGGLRHARVLEHDAAAREDLRQRGRRAGDLLRVRRGVRDVVQGSRRQVPGTAGRHAAEDLTPAVLTWRDRRMPCGRPSARRSRSSRSARSRRWRCGSRRRPSFPRWSRNTGCRASRRRR